ncbi:MAG: hypothetical protein LBR52_04670 [Prevotellaceae bacterium]|jgi:ribosome-binding ATPase YchF (GTP1/OBG family)|nr:hypothetical protein [Prevotellaceae bacterium]
MGIQLIMEIAGMATAVIGSGWISSIVLRKKYLREIDVLNTEIKKKDAETDTAEIENIERILKIQIEYIVEPLKKEINGLRKTINFLRLALEKIGVCPHAAGCPVKHELQNDKDCD